MNWLAKRLRRVWRDENGVATVEFVLMVPILLSIFMGSFESGLMMTRSIMLEQSLDMVMRELRLGHYVNPSATLIKTEVCSRTIMFTNCNADLNIELTKISTTTWTLPTTAIDCVNKTTHVQPPIKVTIGQQNDLMLVRACIVVDALFPTTGIGLELTQANVGGGYKIVAVSAFANEPD
jgi:Flp pilus assembly protein TadG